MDRTPPPHHVTYLRFLRRALAAVTDGGLPYYAWMVFLAAVALVGLNAWAHQVIDGLVITHMTDHVSWGLYIANFTFAVGVAAGGVMMVIPAYLYRDEAMHEVVILGELLAIAAIFVAMAFVLVDLGRPDRFLHLVPGIGQLNWPLSLLSWDVIVLNVYLALNLHVAGYLLYVRFLGRTPDPRWYVPFVFVSIVWAVSIHTVTAFLYSGLGGRPLWNSALLAPRFLASAFVSGPAFLIIALTLVGRLTPFAVGEGPIRTLLRILRITALVNLFMLGSELFTELYTGGAHTASAEYLFFGLHGRGALVPWIWTSVALNVGSLALLFLPRAVERRPLLLLGCTMIFAGVWIEKGLGLIVPGFIPSALHEVVEYLPSLTEWRVTAGIWAFGLLVYTGAIKIAVPILAGGRPAKASEES